MFVPEILAVYVVDEFDVLVPELFVPCQYQVTPLGGVPLVRVLSPQVFVLTVGVDGWAGIGLTFTITPADAPQHNEVLCLDLM